MLKGNQISDVTIKQYTNLEIPIKKRIYGINPLLQNDYGAPNDCTLISITTIIKWLLINLDVNYIYENIEKIAKKWGYVGSYGTPNLTIKLIINKCFRFFNIDRHANSHYLKNIGYDYELIKKQIDLGLPMVLNFFKDGREYQKNHSVLIIGYYYTEHFKMIMVFDNWYNGVTYIDYNKLSLISSIQTI